MKETPQIYADKVIKQYRDSNLVYDMDYSAAIYFAITDVQNTIEAIENIESKWLIGSSIKQYYNEVLTILKDKL